MGKLIACATDTNKNSINQDYCLIVENKIIGISGVIIADGIGSHFKSEIAAKFCSSKLKELIEQIRTIEELNLEILYNHVQLSLMEFAKNSNEFDFNTIDKNSSLGTTLICILDFDNTYLIAYSGNGSIWHVDGRFNTFSKNFYLPWNSINFLNPHTIEQDGKAALYRYLSISDRQYLPTILILNKNQFPPGEIILATTDGIFSNDAVPIGKDSNNTIWIKGEETMPILYSQLSDFLSRNPKDSKAEDLEQVLIQYLSELKEKTIMHDDTTIGIIISENTIEYHQSIYEKQLKSTL
ncbi:protein phosphatase 2C domain-containing protein [Pedobacter suwonensis]|uniref:protein phosphatase 2C domain-containing protein n=1 Tax=Pedobacter suwonensis TaxID=332999 RepID=UPI00119CD491|nr:protein phosphatase 2C domain-containing protein [Pedobacter suwonensis]